MFLKSFDGWKDVGRKDHPILVARFHKADGKRAQYNETALNNFLRNPPPTLTHTDRKKIAGALEIKPA